MTRQVELRWCGEEFPRWHADSSGNVYRDVDDICGNAHPLRLIRCNGHERVFTYEEFVEDGKAWVSQSLEGVSAS